MKALKILLWLLLIAAVLAGAPFAVMEYQYAREKSREDAERVQKAEALLAEALRTNPALAEKLGALRSVSGKGHHRRKTYISVHVEFNRTAHFERGDLKVYAGMRRKYEGWNGTLDIKNWHQYTGPKGEHCLSVDM